VLSSDLFAARVFTASGWLVLFLCLLVLGVGSVLASAAAAVPATAGWHSQGIVTHSSAGHCVGLRDDRANRGPTAASLSIVSRRFVTESTQLVREHWWCNSIGLLSGGEGLRNGFGGLERVRVTVVTVYEAKQRGVGGHCMTKMK